MATDLDGTIVRGDGTISDRTVAAFARVEAAGARFVLVTGRPPRVMRSIAQAFGHRGTAICANGALAYDMRTETIEALHLIPPPALAAAAAALRAAVPGIGIAVEYPDGHAADAVYQALNWDLNQSMTRVTDDVLFARPGVEAARHGTSATAATISSPWRSPRSTAWSASRTPTPRGSSRRARSGSPRPASSPRSPPPTGSAASRSSRSATCPTTCRCCLGRHVLRGRQRPPRGPRRRQPRHRQQRRGRRRRLLEKLYPVAPADSGTDAVSSGRSAPS